LGSDGIPYANLLVTIWGDEFVDQAGDKFYYMGVWTYEACLPVDITISSDKYGARHSQFLDIVPGISGKS
jgi:hypothetical protein